MRAEDRQRHILAGARANGRVEVLDAAAELGVAPETIRRDLRRLERHGFVRRVHGGAYPVDSAGFETNLANRTTHLIAEKRRIAAAAAELLGDAVTVFIDEGYTPQLLAEALLAGHPPTADPLTVVTASLPIAALLSVHPSITVLLLGGRVRGRTLATVDHWATAMLDGFVLDLAYIGSNGISPEHGLTAPDPAVAAVKERAVAQSRRRVFSGVHTKFGANSFCRFAEVADLEAIVTDVGLPATTAHRYASLGPRVIRV